MQAGEESQAVGEAPPEMAKPRPKRRGKVTVFDNWCKGCGLCVAFCPRKVFELGPEGHPVVAQEERCTACNWCVYHCPDFAIVVEVVGDGELEKKAGQVVGGRARR